MKLFSKYTRKNGPPISRKRPDRQPSGSRILRPAVLLAAAALHAGACLTDPFDEDSIVQDFSYHFSSPGTPAVKSRNALIKTIDHAERTLHVVLSSMSDTDVADAVVNAEERGVDVYIAADKVNLDDSDRNAGFVKLQDAGLSIQSNRRTISEQYDSSAEDGRMQSNFVVADGFFCWNSTHGADTSLWDGSANEYTITLEFRSREICTDFQREGKVLAEGGLFSDEGTAAFGDFQHNKGLTDPYSSFDLQGFRFHVFFGAQERPVVALFNHLLNARRSIRFAAAAMTQDFIRDVSDRDANRSHLLNILEYKNKIDSLFGGTFEIAGVIGTDSLLTESVPDPAAYYLDNEEPAATPTQLDISIHEQLAALLGDDLKKETATLGFNMYILDEGTPYAKVIFSSYDMRKRFFNDPINDLYGERVVRDYYDVSDSVTMIIEKVNSARDQSVISDFRSFWDLINDNAGGTF
jgi:hypothetical protein